MYRKWLFYCLCIVLMLASVVVGCAHPGNSPMETYSEPYPGDTIVAPHPSGSGSSSSPPSYAPPQSNPHSVPQGSGMR